MLTATAWGIALVFSWYIIGYLFVAGMGGGAFLIAALSCMWDAVWQTESTLQMSRSVQRGFLLTPCLMMVAALFLILDVGRLDRMWELLVDPFRSIISLGAWFVAMLIAVSWLLAAVLIVRNEAPKTLQWICCIAGSLFAIGTITYTGVLFSAMVSIDFWYTPWIAVLFVVSSLSTGAAAILGCDALLLPSSTAVSPWLWRTATGLTVVEAIVLIGFLMSRFWFTDTSRRSCELLLSGPLAPGFWIGVCAIGILIPLCAHGFHYARSKTAAMVVTSAGMLTGGLSLRFCIVAAAVYTPMLLGVM